MKMTVIATAIALTGTTLVQASSLIHESATFNPTSGSSTIVGDTQFLGSRFTIEQPALVDGIGGQFQGAGTIFGAIVALDDPNAIPTGNPFDDSLQASVVFEISLLADLIIPINVSLTAGTYGVIFGSGQFGATGFGVMGDTHDDIPGQASYFIWGGPSGGPETWNDGGFTQIRFTVYGTVVPEPTAATLALAALCLAMSRRRAC